MLAQSCPLSCHIMSLDLQYHVSRSAWFGVTFFLMSLDMISLDYLFSFKSPCSVSAPVLGVLLTITLFAFERGEGA